jgi:hypothetical protein
MRRTLFAAMLVLFSSGFIHAAENPLGASGGGAKNPLGADAAVDPLAGVFKSEKFSIDLKSDGAQKYKGVIKMAGKEFPATASGDAKALKGTFTSDGQAYEFTATLEGDALTLSSGGATYQLAREHAANPLGAHADPAPAPAAAGGGAAGKLEVIHATQTGQTLFEARQGAHSAKALLPEAIKDLAVYLGVKPAVVGGFADNKDLRGGASFTASVRGHAIKGMIFVGIGDKGGAVTVVFDAADAPIKNLAALAAAAQAPAEIKWEDARLPDGSGSIKLPTGYRITGAANGAVDVVGSGGQSIELGLAYPVTTPEAMRAFQQQQIAVGIRPQPPTVPVAPYPTDPVSALKELIPIFSSKIQAAGGAPVALEKIIESAPAQGLPGGKAAFIHLTSVQGKGDKAVRFHTLALVSYGVTGAGQWLYYTSYVTAPEATFARDLPVMMQVWSSWKVSDAVLQARLKKAMDDMKSAGEMIKQAQAHASKVRSNANADFDEMIRGYRTVEDSETGERHEANLGWVDDVVAKMNENAGYERYKEIPLRDQ